MTASLMIVGSGCDQSSQQSQRQAGDSAELASPAAAARPSRDDHPNEATGMVGDSAKAAAGPHGEQDATPRAQTHDAVANSSSSSHSPLAPVVGKSSKRRKSVTFHTTPAPGFEEQTSPDETAPEVSPAIGIRLAPDVRLPVAAMPIDFTISPVAEEARQQIIKDYYREVADAVMKPATSDKSSVREVTDGIASSASRDHKQPAVAEDNHAVSNTSSSANDSAVALSDENTGTQAGMEPASPAGGVIEDKGEGPTVVITNRPEVDAARERADWRFKALFGDDAYNRMLMYSLLESRLPESAANSAAGERVPLSDGD